MNKLKTALILLLILANIIAWGTYKTPLLYYYHMCGWMANYRPHVYVPMYTCVYLESYGSSSWQVVTWMDAVPMGK